MDGCIKDLTCPTRKPWPFLLRLRPILQAVHMNLFFSWINFQICNLTCSWLTICNFRFEKLDLPGWKIVQCHRHSVQIFSFIAKTLKIQQNFPCSWNKIPNCIYSSSEFQSWSGQLWIDSSKCSSYTFSANWYCKCCMWFYNGWYIASRTTQHFVNRLVLEKNTFNAALWSIQRWILGIY